MEDQKAKGTLLEKHSQIDGEKWKQDPDRKYLVKRRDGTQPNWPYFVLGGRDKFAEAAMQFYAYLVDREGGNPEYAEHCRQIAFEMRTARLYFGAGDPGAPTQRTDDPATIAEMKHA